MRTQAVEYLSIIYMLTSLALLASSRLGMLVKAVTLQGVILAVLPLVQELHHITLSSVLLCCVTLAVKGVIFPRLLLRAIAGANISREVEPLVGYNASLLAGLGMLAFAFWLQIRLPAAHNGGLLLPSAFFGILTGFFITFARRKALTQILGYLCLENGIFAFGAATLSSHPWLLEMGVLLDVFVAVLIMGVAILHISREFSHMDADRLASLRDPAGDA